MALNNTPHIQEDQPDQNSSDFDSVSNNKVEQAPDEIPPYAHTFNGGVAANTSNSSSYNQTKPNTNRAPISNPYPGIDLPYGYPFNPSSIAQEGGVPYYGTQQSSAPFYSPLSNSFIPVSQPNQQDTNSPLLGALSSQNTASQPTLIPDQTGSSFNYDFIESPARIAIYENLKSAPRVIQIEGSATHEYIERIASLTYKYAKEEGGSIPYTVIREVSENFIHAHFQDVIVSIMDSGNTIRFADQGPGITNKELVQEPGFSSATEPMKRYIRGVGSGLPIVKDYLDTTHGYIEIEDNINKGSVVTISLVAPRSVHNSQQHDIPELTENEQRILQALLPDKALGVTDTNRETGIPVASIHTAFSKMEAMGLIEKNNKKRSLTIFGEQVALSL